MAGHKMKISVWMTFLLESRDAIMLKDRMTPDMLYDAYREKFRITDEQRIFEKLRKEINLSLNAGGLTNIEYVVK